MNTSVIYDIFLTSTKNHCFDLVVQALPMLLSDARTGVRQYTDEETDLEKLHGDYTALLEQDGQLRKFIGRHYDSLVKAYQLRDRAAFDAVVAQCAAADAAAQEEEDGNPNKEDETQST